MVLSNNGQSLNAMEQTYLIAGLISVIDSFFRHHFWSKKVGKFAKIDTIPQSLLQFGGRGQVLLQAGLHPPEYTKIDLRAGTGF